MKKIILAASAFLFFGCSQKGEITYYLPLSKNTAQANVQKATSVSVESVSYLCGDRIWYKKEGLFLPYKNSYFAKTPKEFVGEELQNLAIDANLSVTITDAYQLYENDKSSFVLTVRAEAQKADGSKQYKMFKIKKDGFKAGAAEGVRGFEESVEELTAQIRAEFGGNK